MNAPSLLYDKSLSGHPLEGNRLVRFIYVDEAGISKHEPIAVVTGVIVHADTQWRPVAESRFGEGSRSDRAPSRICFPRERVGEWREGFHPRKIFSRGENEDIGRSGFCAVAITVANICHRS